jgi:iron(III) transport system ATP-binding protein
MISIRDVSARFGAKLALDRVCFQAPAQAITAVLGESGSGKSTLLRAIAGLTDIAEGEVRFGDRVMSAPGRTAPTETRGIGFVFQDFALFPHLRLIDNISFGLADLAAEIRTRKAQEWLERVGLSARARAYPHELSGGEQQRIALARALAPAPKVVLLDEPFSSLDPSMRVALRDQTVSALRESGAAAIFVTHDSDEALYVADQIAVLRHGRLLQWGPPAALYDRPASSAVASALGPINIWRGQVRAERMETPFGIIPAPGVADGPGELVVRAEAIVLAPGPGAQVVERRLQGALDLVRFTYAGTLWRALAPRRDDGANLTPTLDHRGVFVFSV